MATNRENYPGTARTAPSWNDKSLHQRSKVPGYRMPSHLLGRLFESDMGMQIGGGRAYLAGDWTITTGGTGDAIAQATTSGGGVLITAASDDNFDTTMDWANGVATPVAGKWYTCLARVQVNDITQIGFKLGLTTGGGQAALPFGTEYTDAITLSKAITTGVVTGRARGDSGTAAVSDTLGTMANATEVEIGFTFYCATVANGAAGFWYYNGVETPFTAAQVAQIAKLLDTAATCYWTLHVTGTTGNNPTLLVTSALATRSR